MSQNPFKAVFAFFLTFVIILACGVLGIQVYHLLSKGNAARGRYSPADQKNSGVVLSQREMRARAQSDFSYFAGPQQARVEVVEFVDYQCPYSGQEYSVVQQLMAEYHTAPVKFTFRQFPLTNIHPAAYDAARATLCAQEQNKFIDLHNAFFEHQEQLSPETVEGFAQSVGLQPLQFRACMDERRGEGVLQKDIQDGIALGLKGTPTFFINGAIYTGAYSYEELKAAIDQELR